MEFNKKIIDDIFKCYSVNAINIDGEINLIYAAEGQGSCQIYSGSDFDKKKVLWDNDDKQGGTMSVVTVPDKEGYFFVSKGFFSMVDSETSGIYLVRYIDGEFIEERILDIPYLHRFDIININDRRFLIAAALHSGKVDKQDWSKPGKVFVSELPKDLDKKINVELTLLKEGLTKNHGFNKGIYKGMEVAFVASEEGVIAIIPPQENTGKWEIEEIFTHPISDVAAIDLDDDGELEFALLSPFHGDQLDIIKKIDGEYRSVYKYPKHLDFYHAIFADTFNGIPSFVIGARKEDMDLYLVQFDSDKGEFISYLIDSNVGAANARIIHTKDGDMIMAANRQIGQAAYST